MSDNDGYLPLPKSFATITIHEAQEPEQWAHNEVVTPISMTTTFKQDAPGEFKRYQYGRTGNPTREVLEKVIAKLECAKHAACLGSGLGAITTLLDYRPVSKIDGSFEPEDDLSRTIEGHKIIRFSTMPSLVSCPTEYRWQFKWTGLLESGDHLICIDDVYGGTNRLLQQVATKFGIEVSFAECDVGSFEKQIKFNTKMIFAETPTNPTLQICDIAAVSQMAKKYNVLVAIDNTFLSPYFQRPILLGADVVIHSLTKYMNGHSDVCMGALVTNDDAIGEKINTLQKVMGVVPSPFDCYQVLRSLKTLSLRMQQHSRSALTIAKHFEGHPKIEKVLHPGLSSHPQHDLAKRQSSGHSGMFSIYLKGDLEASRRFLKALKYFTLGGSLGGCESLIALSSIMTHSSVPKDQKDELGITDNLLRISVGLEDTEDLIADLEQALEKV